MRHRLSVIRTKGLFGALFVTLFIVSAGVQYASAEQEIYDPLEPINRGIFWFNDQVDIYFFEPVAKGYDFVTPRPVQRGISNFFDNLKFPIRFVSSVVQLKFAHAGRHTGRFVVNSTLGIGGFMDPAKQFGLEAPYADFGTALGYHNVGPGPYIVIPFLGPSNVRDGFGRIVDSFLNPTFYVGPVLDLSTFESVAVSGGIYLVDAVNTRAEFLDAVKSAKEASIDYYLFTQSAYYQIRRNQIYEGAPPDDWDYDEDFEDEYFEEED